MATEKKLEVSREREIINGLVENSDLKGRDDAVELLKALGLVVRGHLTSENDLADRLENAQGSVIRFKEDSLRSKRLAGSEAFAIQEEYRLKYKQSEVDLLKSYGSWADQGFPEEGQKEVIKGINKTLQMGEGDNKQTVAIHQSLHRFYTEALQTKMQETLGKQYTKEEIALAAHTIVGFTVDKGGTYVEEGKNKSGSDYVKTPEAAEKFTDIVMRNIQESEFDYGTINAEEVEKDAEVTAAYEKQTESEQRTFNLFMRGMGAKVMETEHASEEKKYINTPTFSSSSYTFFEQGALNSFTKNSARKEDQQIDFSGINFSGMTVLADTSEFSNTNVSHSDFSGSDLSKANFSGANLTGANLAGANLAGADLTGATGLTAEQLSKAKGVDQVKGIHVSLVEEVYGMQLEEVKKTVSDLGNILDLQKKSYGAMEDELTSESQGKLAPQMGKNFTHLSAQVDELKKKSGAEGVDTQALEKEINLLKKGVNNNHKAVEATKALLAKEKGTTVEELNRNPDYNAIGGVPELVEAGLVLDVSKEVPSAEKITVEKVAEFAQEATNKATKEQFGQDWKAYLGSSEVSSSFENAINEKLRSGDPKAEVISQENVRAVVEGFYDRNPEYRPEHEGAFNDMVDEQTKYLGGKVKEALLRTVDPMASAKTAPEVTVEKVQGHQGFQTDNPGESVVQSLGERGVFATTAPTAPNTVNTLKITFVGSDSETPRMDGFVTRGLAAQKMENGQPLLKSPNEAKVFCETIKKELPILRGFGENALAKLAADAAQEAYTKGETEKTSQFTTEELVKLPSVKEAMLTKAEELHGKYKGYSESRLAEVAWGPKASREEGGKIQTALEILEKQTERVSNFRSEEGAFEQALGGNPP